MTKNVEEILDKNFPSLLDTDLVEGIKEQAEYRHVSEGDLLIDIGSVIESIPMIVSGSVKVMREDEDGNELLLYYVQPERPALCL